MRIYILNIFMYKRFIYFITLLSFFNSTAQEINSLWETHFSYNNVNDLESNEPYIYASSDNSIFIYNTETSELSKITTKEGFLEKYREGLHHLNFICVLFKCGTVWQDGR